MSFLYRPKSMNFSCKPQLFRATCMRLYLNVSRSCNKIPLHLLDSQSTIGRINVLQSLRLPRTKQSNGNIEALPSPELIRLIEMVLLHCLHYVNALSALEHDRLVPCVKNHDQSQHNTAKSAKRRLQPISALFLIDLQAY